MWIPFLLFYDCFRSYNNKESYGRLTSRKDSDGEILHGLCDEEIAELLTQEDSKNAQKYP